MPYMSGRSPLRPPTPHATTSPTAGRTLRQDIGAPQNLGENTGQKSRSHRRAALLTEVHPSVTPKNDTHVVFATGSGSPGLVPSPPGDVPGGVGSTSSRCRTPV